MTILDLNAEIRSLCDADTTSYTAADLLRRVNNALETCVAFIINADGTWQFDDTNYSTTPIGTATLIDAQQAYTFADDFLDIEEVRIKDSGGTYRRIDPIDPSDRDFSLEEEFGTTTGFPRYYDKLADTIKLYPTPSSTDVTLTAGLKVIFKRTADLFTSAQVTTGTKVPGIASPYHQLLAYMAALPFCLSYKKDRVPLFEKKIQEMTRDMITFYSRREKDLRKIITMRPIRHR